MIGQHLGVVLNGKHSLNDYSLIMKSVSIGLPKPKTEIVSIPGRDGVLDLSETLAGRICYSNREISIAFTLHGGNSEWLGKVSELSNDLHGKIVKIQFDADSNWYFEGRCSVEDFTSQEMLPTIKVNCDAKPYKMSNAAISILNRTSVLSTKDITFRTSITKGAMEISASNGMKITLNQKAYNIYSGQNKIGIIDFLSEDNFLSIKGSGEIEIKIREGRI